MSVDMKELFVAAEMDLREATDRIEVLERENARLRAALKVFADAHDGRKRGDMWASFASSRKPLSQQRKP